MSLACLFNLVLFTNRHIWFFVLTTSNVLLIQNCNISLQYTLSFGHKLDSFPA